MVKPPISMLAIAARPGAGGWGADRRFLRVALLVCCVFLPLAGYMVNIRTLPDRMRRAHAAVVTDGALPHHHRGDPHHHPTAGAAKPGVATNQEKGHDKKGHDKKRHDKGHEKKGHGKDSHEKKGHDKGSHPHGSSHERKGHHHGSASSSKDRHRGSKGGGGGGGAKSQFRPNARFKPGTPYHVHTILNDTVYPDACDEKDLPPGAWSDAATRHGLHGAWFGTVAAQKAIWAHQNPADCAAAKFVIVKDIPVSGIGSTLHVLSAIFGHAMSVGRVVLLAPNGIWWVDLTDAARDGGYCRGANNTLDTCYFHPLSKCTLVDAGVTTHGQLASLPRMASCNPATDADKKVVRAGFDYTWPTSCNRDGPFPFHDLLAKSHIKRDRWYYWWRAQAVAYIVRPNERTLGEIARRRAAHLRTVSGGKFKSAAVPPQVGSISVHVRHGDKIIEGVLAPDVDYDKSADIIANASMCYGHGTYDVAPFVAPGSSNGGGGGSMNRSAIANYSGCGAAPVRRHLSRHIVLTTEDPGSVAYFSAQARWTVTYADVPRKGDSSLSAMSKAMVRSLSLQCARLSCPGGGGGGGLRGEGSRKGAGTTRLSSFLWLPVVPCCLPCLPPSPISRLGNHHDAAKPFHLCPADEVAN